MTDTSRCEGTWRPDPVDVRSGQPTRGWHDVLPGARGDASSGAVFDPERRNRFALWRVWDDAVTRRILFIGLNPSTADERVADPTLRRCIGFAMKAGFGGLFLGNICSFRSPEPSRLPVRDQESERNYAALCLMHVASHQVVAAWGAHTLPTGAKAVRERIEAWPDVMCFGETKGGHPRHPLYLRSDTAMRPWHCQGTACSSASATSPLAAKATALA